MKQSILFNEIINISDIVTYKVGENTYLGKVVELDKENQIAYVWFGINNLPAATKLDDLNKVCIANQTLNKMFNASISELIFFNDDYLANGDNVYNQSLHKMIKEFNESNYSYKLNELDYVLRIKNELPLFAKVVKELNHKFINEEMKLSYQ